MLHIADKMSPESPLKQVTNNVTITAGYSFLYSCAILAGFNLKFVRKLPPLCVRCERDIYDIDLIH